MCKSHSISAEHLQAQLLKKNCMFEIRILFMYENRKEIVKEVFGH